MTTPDPRIDILAKAAGDRMGKIDSAYYHMAAKEFLAFADALQDHYSPPDKVGVNAADLIRDKLGRSLRLARSKVREGEEAQAGAFLGIAMEMQDLLDKIQ